MKQPFIPDDPGAGEDEMAHSEAQMLAYALCAMSGALFVALIGLATWWLR